MIKEVKISNYKSIDKLKIELGRINVLIGENGCGKSNILESIALSAAAANDKLDNEFMVSRGIRVTEPTLMRSVFEKEKLDKNIILEIFTDSESSIKCELNNDNKPYSKWEIRKLYEEKELFDIEIKSSPNGIETLKESIRNRQKVLRNFLIFSPEYKTLRTFQEEGQIQPLGIYGEGLFKLLKVFSMNKNQNEIKKLNELLILIDWFEEFKLPSKHFEVERFIEIKDRFVDEAINSFDQKSTNEGFLFLMFYFSLFISKDTPQFFAIDNIDASLNPKLCSELMVRLVQLAKEYDKQVIFTTHNPSVLDGLNLDDDEQRLFMIYRNKNGHTKAQRILKKETPEGQEPVKLSEAFVRGYIGGLPKNF